MALFQPFRFAMLLAVCLTDCDTAPTGNETSANNASFYEAEHAGCPDILTTLSDIVRQLEDKKTTRFPPVHPNSGTVVPAKINLLPLRLLHVDDARSRLEIGLLVQVFWHDPRLAWVNTTMYDKDCASKLPARLSLRNIRHIWTPIFVLAETSSATKLGLHELFESMQVSQNGSIYYVGRYRGHIVCPMKRKFYPFDEQVCNITVLGGGLIRYEVGNTGRTEQQRHGLATASNNNNNSDAILDTVLDSYRQTLQEAHLFGRQMTTNEWELNPTDEQLLASLTKPIPINHPQQHSGEELHSDIKAQSLVFRIYLRRNSWPLVWTEVIPPIIISTTSVTALYVGCPPSARFGYGSSIVITLSLLIRSLKYSLEIGDDGNPLLEWLYLGLFLVMILATTMSEIPHALAKRLKSHQNDGKGAATKAWPAELKRSCFCLIVAVGCEETINVCFASFFLSLQALLIGYVVGTWIYGPGKKF